MDMGYEPDALTEIFHDRGISEHFLKIGRIGDCVRLGIPLKQGILCLLHDDLMTFQGQAEFFLVLFRHSDVHKGKYQILHAVLSGNGLASLQDPDDPSILRSKPVFQFNGVA